MTAVQNNHVADRYLIPDHGCRTTRLIIAIVADMHDGVVLDVTARTNPDVVDIATDHTKGPNRTVRPDLHLPDHQRRIIDIGTAIQLRVEVFKGTDGHLSTIPYLSRLKTFPAMPMLLVSF